MQTLPMQIFVPGAGVGGGVGRGVAEVTVTAPAVDVWVVPANAGIPARRQRETTRIDVSFFVVFSF
jgi:hypothetical protein